MSNIVWLIEGMSEEFLIWYGPIDYQRECWKLNNEEYQRLITMKQVETFIYTHANRFDIKSPVYFKDEIKREHRCHSFNLMDHFEAKGK